MREIRTSSSMRGRRKRATAQRACALLRSPWLSLDVLYPQASTNAIRVYVGEQKIRNQSSAEYFVRWIDKLRALTSGPGGGHKESGITYSASSMRLAADIRRSRTKRRSSTNRQTGTFYLAGNRNFLFGSGNKP